MHPTANSAAFMRETPAFQRFVAAGIAVGGNFTLEAAEMLRERKVEILSLKDFAWTDKSYEDIKVLIGAKVKRPVD
jgi:hypothetical protein